MESPAIRTVGLTKHFGPVVALDGLDLEVSPGEIFGFLGPNGAGKSTTIRLLLGLIRPTAGQAWLAGVPVGDVERAHRSVAYVPGDVALWPQLTGARDPRAPRQPVRRRRPGVPRRAGRALRPGSQPAGPGLLQGQPAEGRPGRGVHDPPGDPAARRADRGARPADGGGVPGAGAGGRRGGQTVFLSSHLLDEVEDVCHRVAILRAGVLVEVAALEELRRLATTIFEAVLTGPVPDLVDVCPASSASSRWTEACGSPSAARRARCSPGSTPPGSPAAEPRADPRADLPDLLRDQALTAPRRGRGARALRGGAARQRPG